MRDTCSWLRLVQLPLVAVMLFSMGCDDGECYYGDDYSYHAGRRDEFAQAPRRGERHVVSAVDTGSAGASGDLGLGGAPGEASDSSAAGASSDPGEVARAGAQGDG